MHFPHLTVSQTLAVAAKARAPTSAVSGFDRDDYAETVRDATAAALGLSHTLDTKMGNDFVLGISGGERKRASIAEILVGGSLFQCWDNSTRGLDSANALEFVNTLRASTRIRGSVALVSLYQASQDIYDVSLLGNLDGQPKKGGAGALPDDETDHARKVFDKVALLYEGRQIFFGDARTAKLFFTNLGFACSDRATTADFLTSLTNPVERAVREGYELRVPRTPDEFAEVWRKSPERGRLQQEIWAYEKGFPTSGQQLDRFRASQTARKAASQ